MHTQSYYPALSYRHIMSQTKSLSHLMFLYWYQMRPTPSLWHLMFLSWYQMRPTHTLSHLMFMSWYQMRPTPSLLHLMFMSWYQMRPPSSLSHLMFLSWYQMRLLHCRIWCSCPCIRCVQLLHCRIWCSCPGIRCVQLLHCCIWCSCPGIRCVQFLHCQIWCSCIFRDQSPTSNQTMVLINHQDTRVKTMIPYWKSSKMVECARCQNLSKLKGIKRGSTTSPVRNGKNIDRTEKSENFWKKENFKFTIGSNRFQFLCEGVTNFCLALLHNFLEML